MARMLLPALGEYPTMEELAPSRHLEYVAAEGLALGVLSVILFVVMLFFVLTALHYRWVRRGRTASILLLPDGAEVARLLAYGALLPLAGYYLVTRWLPWGPRDLGLGEGKMQFLAQLLTLHFVVLGLTLTIAGRLVRRRCRELQLPLPPPPHRLWKIAGWSMVAALAIPTFLPWEWLHRNVSVIIWMAISPLVILVCFVHGISRDVRFGCRCAAYYGSLARTMIPVVALTLILVNICSRPYLRLAERRLMASDTVMRVDPNGGLTTVEARLIQRLKNEIQMAAEKK